MEKENSKFKPLKLCFKIDLIISCSCGGVRNVYTYDIKFCGKFHDGNSSKLHEKLRTFQPPTQLLIKSVIKNAIISAVNFVNSQMKTIDIKLDWVSLFNGILTSIGYLMCPVGWGCRIHWLRLCRGVRTPPQKKNECPRYDTKESDGKVPVMLELWGMWSTPSLPSLLGPLWPGVVAPDRALSMGQIELNCILMLNWTAWNRTVFDIETEFFKIALFWHLTV